MSQPRFLLVAGTARGGLSRPAWPDIDTPLTGEIAGDNSWVSWRLTGANHRELGRSMRVFPDSPAAVESVNALRRSLGETSSSIVASARDGRRTWRLLLGAETVAISGRPYARHRECAYSLDTFLAAVPLAEILDSITRRPTITATGSQRQYAG